MRPLAALLLCLLLAALLLFVAAAPSAIEERLVRHRNLGKAFYENPTTQKEAVEEFRKALELAPDSPTDRLNYGLALLRAGRTAEGIAELERVQKAAPQLPHTWFNLGIAYKKLGEHEKALAQFERMIQLVPDEPISHYNAGALYRLLGRTPEAIKEFEIAAKLDPHLAAPHFQLFNLYRALGRAEEAKRELEIFQQLKKQQEGAAIPEDVEWSWYAEVYDQVQDRPADLAPVKLAFHPSKLPASSGVTLIRAATPAGLRPLWWSAAPLPKDTIAVAPGDFNNDGFIDLCVLSSSGAVLWTGGPIRFAPTKIQLPPGPFHAALWLDYDRDYDLDLFLLGPKSHLLRNAGAAGFQEYSTDFPFAAGEAVSAVAFRTVADSKAIDLLVSYRDRAAVLYRDRLAGKYEPAAAPLPPGATRLLAEDINNDGSIDVVFESAGALYRCLNRSGQLEAPQEITRPAGAFVLADLDNRGLLDLVLNGQVFRNNGDGSFSAPRSLPDLPPCAMLAAADLDGNGTIDLACASRPASFVLSNVSAVHRWLQVQLTGVKNPKTAPYAEVEVKAGTRYAKRIYPGFPLHFGLGREPVAETVRITWPNGLIQNEIRQPAGRRHAWQEAQRLSGSCPMIWTWNGREFEFIADVLGVAPLGASAGDGSYFPLDHDEYIQIPGRSLQPRAGKLEVRVTEELSEVSYLDQIQLIAVDHPGAVAIYTNDKFSSPPFPEFRLFGVEKAIRPLRARDHRGRDQLAQLLRRDKSYVADFARDYQGTAELHSLELDFGPVLPDGKAILVLHGWVDWADGSTFRAISQVGGPGLAAPSLAVKDASGAWRTVLEDMGMPAGKPKTIVVDLTGRWLSPARQVRITTNFALYWDEIFLAPAAGPPPHRLTALAPRSADLHFRGFSQVRIHPTRRQPEEFVYSNPRPVAQWNPTPGLYTRYGEVTELLEQVDDRFVIMGSGDELRVAFEAKDLPPLPPGWTRDYLLLVDGWAKDRDPNTAYSQSVEPLPFHGMSRYPYPPHEHFPDTPAHRLWRQQYNTRPALRPLRPLLANRTPTNL